MEKSGGIPQTIRERWVGWFVANKRLARRKPERKGEQTNNEDKDTTTRLANFNGARPRRLHMFFGKRFTETASNNMCLGNSLARDQFPPNPDNNNKKSYASPTQCRIRCVVIRI